MINKATRLRMLLIKLEEISEKLKVLGGSDKTEFAGCIKAFRELTEMTPNQFSQYFGVSVQSLYRWEKVGVSNSRSAKKICRAIRKKLNGETESEEYQPKKVSPEELIKVTLTFEIKLDTLQIFLMVY